MLDSCYLNGYGYQENLLPAKHKQIGFNVAIITCMGGNPSAEHCSSQAYTYTSQEGIPVHVLADNTSALRRIPFVVGWTDKTVGLFEKLNELSPDIIFIHNICLHDYLASVKYVRLHPATALYGDNHSDYYNSPVNTLREKSYRLILGRYMGKRVSSIAKRVWGVTPWRVRYLTEVYYVPAQKTGLLVMGGDEDKIAWNQRATIRQNIRHQYDIPDDGFLIITGGKIDRTKNIHLLIEAVANLHLDHVHLLIFGSVAPDMEQYMNKIADPHIHVIGWIKADQAYDHFLAADLACFPGTHSVLWEQACASGLPAIFKDWDGGFSHVDIGGNCELLRGVSAESIAGLLRQFVTDKTFYDRHKEIAAQKGRRYFSYIEIAKKAIGMN